NDATKDQRNTILFHLNEIIISRTKSVLTPELWINGIVPELPLTQIEEAFLATETSRQSKITILQKISFSERIKFLDSIAKSEGWETAYELINGIIQIKRPGQ